MRVRHGPGRQRRMRRIGAVVMWGLAAAHVVEALILRARRRAVTAGGEGAGGAPGDPPGAGGPGAGGDVDGPGAGPRPELVTLPGVEVDGVARSDAAATMEATGAGLVDLVPGDLPTERSLRFLRRVAPERLASDVLYAPGGAHEVLAVGPDVTRRMGPAPAAEGGAAGPEDRGQMRRRTVRAQRHVPGAARVQLARGLRSSSQSPEDRWRELEETFAPTRTVVSVPPLVVGAESLHLLALTAGAAVAPVAGLAALATWVAQPAVVFGGPRRGSGGTSVPGAAGCRGARVVGPGTGVGDAVPGRGGTATGWRPPDLGRASALRLLQRWDANLRTLAAGYRATRTARAASAARAGHVPCGPPEGELFDPARDTCPWCGAGDLAPVLDTTDLLQRKPGRFHLDECRACGHIFQNPALSVAGLDHYYRDFYDGAGEDQWEAAFTVAASATGPVLREVGALTTPGAWLDVGTGHGHLCLMARQEWPGAVVDGLDMGEAVEEAARRGWIDTAYRGMFPDVAPALPRSYDVVSMFHYLEHTRDPRAELAAAAQAVRPGGHVVIEVPDPDHAWSRRLGRFWFCWLQPQHQHLLPHGNMVAALDEAGFDVVSSDRGTATLGNDLVFAVCLAVQAVAASPHAPWLPPATVGQRLRRAAAVGAAVPAALVAVVADQVKDARLAPEEPGSAYRVIARRR